MKKEQTHRIQEGFIHPCQVLVEKPIFQGFWNSRDPFKSQEESHPREQAMIQRRHASKFLIDGII